MSLSLTPRYGARQYRSAAAYFTLVIQDLLQEKVGPLDATHYMIAEQGGRSIPVRLWEDPSSPRVSLEDHMRLLARVEEAVEGARNSDGTPAAMAQVISAIPHHLSSSTLHTFVLEQLDQEQAFTTDERTALMVGVVDELLVFIRSEELTLVQLGEGLYGCALRGRGSYLIEVTAGEPANADHVHHDHR